MAFGFGGDAPQIEKKSATLEQLLSPYLRTGDVTARTSSGALSLYRQSSAVSIVINKIARQIKQLRPVILLNDGNDMETSHDILDLLDNPAPEWSRTRFMETLAVNYLATSEAFVWCAGNIRNAPLEMVPISSDKITVNETSNDIPVSYAIYNGPYKGVFKRMEQRVNGKRVVRYIDASNMAELLVIRGVDTQSTSGLKPQSKLRPIQDEINQVLKANKHNLSMLANGGRLSLVFTLKGAGQDEFEDAQQRLKEQYRGADAAGTISVISAEDTKVEEFGITPKDMDFEAMQKTAILRVAQEFDIPGILVNNDNSTFNNMDTARELMWDDAIFPVVTSVYEGLEDFLLMRFGISDKDADLWFDESKVPALRMRRVEEVKARREANVETIDELRTVLGLDEYGDGGDKIYEAATKVPLGTGFDSDPRRDVVKPNDDG